MSRMTAAFVCALCDPDNPRPASIMCSNNCGRYVCAIHAISRKGPGSAMVCQACAEALGLADKPKPKPVFVPEVRPLIEISPEPAPQPIDTQPAPPLVVTQPEPASTVAETATTATTAAVISAVSEQPTSATVPVMPPPKEAVVIDAVVPIEQQSAARRVVEPEPTPKSTASETVVSQRGNTLQVPKVTPTLGKPPTPIGPKPRKAQRAGEGLGNNLDWKLIGSVAGSMALGIAGLVLILVAITP